VSFLRKIVATDCSCNSNLEFVNTAVSCEACGMLELQVGELHSGPLCSVIFISCLLLLIKK